MVREDFVALYKKHSGQWFYVLREIDRDLNWANYVIRWGRFDGCAYEFYKKEIQPDTTKLSRLLRGVE